MKVILAFLAVAVLSAAAYTDIPSDPSFYENLLKNDEGIKKLLGCLLDMVPCDEFGTHAKNHIVETMSNSCKDCNPMQKHYTKLFDALVKQEQFREYYQPLKAKYDPDDVYMPKLDKSVASY